MKINANLNVHDDTRLARVAAQSDVDAVRAGHERLSIQFELTPLPPHVVRIVNAKLRRARHRLSRLRQHGAESLGSPRQFCRRQRLAVELYRQVAAACQGVKANIEPDARLPCARLDRTQIIADDDRR